jgi:hypothetical protein
MGSDPRQGGPAGKLGQQASKPVTGGLKGVGLGLSGTIAARVRPTALIHIGSHEGVEVAFKPGRGQNTDRVGVAPLKDVAPELRSCAQGL